MKNNPSAPAKDPSRIDRDDLLNSLSARDAWHPVPPSRSAPRRGAHRSDAPPPADASHEDGRRVSDPFAPDATPAPFDSYADGWAAGIRAMNLHPDRLETFLQGIRDAIRETKNRNAAQREVSR
jgi:hypothetical protein